MGWSGRDMEAVIQLDAPLGVRRVGVDCLRAQGPWIFLPRWVEVALSEDGQRWVSAGRTEVPLENNAGKAAVRVEVEVPTELAASKVRYLRVLARNRGQLPDWHPGSPDPAWLFVDEIVVEGE
jgi:hexosaminidase